MLAPSTRSGRMPRGFTLIELLIVIAIILILIAIALPNFLEAQARAKVTRERSDIRSIATAIESLRTDRNVLLVDFWDDDSTQIRSARFGDRQDCTSPGSFITKQPATFFACCCWHRQDRRGGTSGIFMPLTTPVAYLSSVPIDPFKFEGDFDLVPGDQDEPISYQYIDNESEDTRLDNNDPLTPIGVFGCYRPPGCPNVKPLGKDHYVLIGFGPDLDRQPAYDIPYAPTNGTKSRGDVLYRSDLGPI